MKKPIDSNPQKPTIALQTTSSAMGATAAAARPGSISTKKKWKKRWVAIAGVVGALLIAAAVIGFLVLKPASAAEAESQIMGSTVSKGNVSTTVEGTGTLSNSSTAEIYIGNVVEVEEVMVSAGDSVVVGDVLATVEPISLNLALYTAAETLDDIESDLDSASTGTAEYYQLLLDQKNTQEEYDILAAIAKTNTITATSDGIITAVNVSGTVADDTNGAAVDDSASGDADNVEQATLDSSDSGVLRSAVYSVGNSMKTAYVLTTDEVLAEEDDGDDDSGGDVVIETIYAIDLSAAKLAPVLDATPVVTITGTSFTGTVDWQPTDATFKDGVTYTAEITLVANDDHVFASTPSLTIDEATEVIYEWVDSKTLKIKTSFEPLEKADKPADEQETPSGQTPSGSEQSSGQPAQSGSSPSGSSSGMTGSSGLSSSTTPVSESAASDPTSGASNNLTSAFTVATGDQMVLTVSVDELDILSISKGQTARVTLDALEGQVFEGSITKVNTSGTSSDGVTKYSAEVTLPKNESMLAGMNASVSIVIEESSDTLYVPAAAIQEDGTRSFVYTQKDESTGVLSGDVDVEIGNADGAVVEIISGLAEGDTVYYEVMTSTAEGEMIFGMGGGMGNMGTFNGGERPDMGTMPEGGSFSQQGPTTTGPMSSGSSN